MKGYNSPLARQIQGLGLREPALTEALYWMEKGEVLADLLIGIARLFRRQPDLRPATR